MPSFVLLHLSDLHFDALETEAVPQARRTVVLQGLVRALRDLLSTEPGLQPNALVIPGDIAYRGSRGDYYLAEVYLFTEPDVR
jgi:3',5'-cyclic AMP phosphodiesterase CpdA